MFSIHKSLLITVLLLLMNHIRYVQSLGSLLIQKLSLFNVNSIQSLKFIKKYIKMNEVNSQEALQTTNSSINTPIKKRSYRKRVLDNEISSYFHRNQEISDSISDNYNQTKISPEIGTRVVTDIDDTVKSSGGVKVFGIALGGIDVSNIFLVIFE